MHRRVNSQTVSMRSSAVDATAVPSDRDGSLVRITRVSMERLCGTSGTMLESYCRDYVVPLVESVDSLKSDHAVLLSASGVRRDDHQLKAIPVARAANPAASKVAPHCPCVTGR